ncbi:AAA family ATPase [Streptomyces sp. 4N124]|uniref:AAA family ATPase n=1 Tax=Streptomyces sp. 4N124 TaxID=3457420 RepID=UPI003FD57EE6
MQHRQYLPCPSKGCAESAYAPPSEATKNDEYGGHSVGVYFALVDYCAAIRNTEERQEKAQKFFSNDADYVSFMQVVQVQRDKGDIDRQRELESYADEYALKDEAKELAKQRREDALRAAFGVAEQSVVSGADFILNRPETPVAVWGDGDDVLLAQGEALMLVGKGGVGKTTVGVQFLRARLGITDKAMGFTVQPSKKSVLYLACDRPEQAARAMARVFTKDDAAVLDRRLKVWKGPPPFDFAQHTDALLNMCLEAGADTVIIDSLKDVALNLSEDGVGSAYNRARQLCLVNGITVVELHHQVKRGANGATPNKIEDVYGSTWLTAGAGSVVILDGEAGDPVVKFRHLKQPINEIGPLDLYHDHETGVSTLGEKADLVALAQHTAITRLDAARAMFDTDKPTPAEKQKATRALEKLVKSGQLKVIHGGVGAADTYYPALAFVPKQAEAETYQQEELDAP